MTRRAQRVMAAALAAQVTGHARVPDNLRLPWSGTFHAVGNRLIREHARRLGLDPGFSVLDRGDAADLIDVVRHRLGFSKTEKRFPAQGHLPRHLLASRQHAAAAAAHARNGLSVVPRVGGAAHGALPRLRRGQARTAGARLRRPAALLARDDARRRARGRTRRALRPRARRRIPGHERAAGGHPAAAEAGRGGAHRRRRRRAGDLLVPCRDGRQHPRLSRRGSRRPRAW